MVPLLISVAFIVAVVLGLAALWIAGYVRAQPWTGIPEIPLKDDVRPQKTTWDWLHDLIIPLLIPVTLAVLGFWVTNQQQTASETNSRTAIQDNLLTTYLDHMSPLILQEHLSDRRAPSAVRTVASSWTLGILPALDGSHKRTVVQFLYRSGAQVSLDGADLTEADLSDLFLEHSDLPRVDLRGANLRGRLVSSWRVAKDLRIHDGQGLYRQALLATTCLSASRCRRSRLMTLPIVRGMAC